MVNKELQPKFREHGKSADFFLLFSGEGRSETKLVVRLVDPLFGFFSSCNEFVSLTPDIDSSWIAPRDRLVVSRDISPLQFVVCRVCLVDARDHEMNRSNSRSSGSNFIVFEPSSGGYVTF